jgi:hypothetical protein
VINTDRGMALFDSVKARFELKKHSLSDVVPLQSYGKKHKLDVNMRRHTLDLLSSEIYLE